MKKKEEKVLVLVTAQKKSLRLIEYGFTAAQECGGELHILHVQKGDSIFDGKETISLLQNLAGTGARMGGIVHICCGDSISACIGQFVQEEGMTQVVMGCGREMSVRRKKGGTDEYERILAALPAKIGVTVVPEEVRKEKAAVWRKMRLCTAGV